MSKEPSRISARDDPEQDRGKKEKLLFRYRSGFLYDRTITFAAGSLLHSNRADIVKPANMDFKPDPIDLASANTYRERIDSTSDLATGIEKLNPLGISVSDNISVGDNFHDGIVGASQSQMHYVPSIEVALVGSELKVQPGSVGQPNVSWAEQLSWLLPKEIGEEFLGDLLEKRARMAAQGCSPRYIEWFSVFQIILSVTYRVWRIFG